MTWIGWLVGAAVTAWVVGAVVYASWLRHEAHKARRESEQRKTLDRIVHASMTGCSSQPFKKEAPRG